MPPDPEPTAWGRRSAALLDRAARTIAGDLIAIQEAGDAFDEAAGEAVGSTLTDACHIIRRTETRDAAGGTRLIWATVELDVPCRFEKVTRMTEGEVAEGVRGITTWRALLPLGTDVTRQDRLVKASDTSLEWEVTETDRGITDPTVLTAQLTKIDE